MLVSDNGPCFTSREFSDFAKEWGFNQIFSCSKQSHQNGLAERGVQAVKNFLEKNQDAEDALLAYRSAPLQNEKSPPQLLFNSEVRTKVPRIIRKLDDEELRKIEEQQRKASENYDNEHHRVVRKINLERRDILKVPDLNREGYIEKRNGRRVNVRIGKQAYVRTLAQLRKVEF
ncbi:uncharacterized protein [Lepeophtheirus salmonis]|uniref:uncharacterized protein n=1 Tax=Lepeophtheirus salmonis TaxID=72036 RepID=UPI003AF39F6B